MARSLTILLRICVIATAAAMLLLCAHAARAQNFSPATGSTAAPPAGATDSVYGFNPGQGTPQSADPLEQGAGYAPAPQQAAPQAPYGYYPSMAQQAASAPSPYPPAAQPQAPYGYNAAQYAAAAPPGPLQRTTNYGTQAPTDPQAFYQQPYNGGARTNST